jgi:hypothetical protein
VKRIVGVLEPEMVDEAGSWWARMGDPLRLISAFRSGTVWTRRYEDPPRLSVTDTGATGKWILVFSSLARLGAYVGPCDWVSTTGAKLQDELLPGVDVQGVVLDAGEPHWVALPLEPPTAAIEPVGADHGFREWSS